MTGGHPIAGARLISIVGEQIEYFQRGGERDTCLNQNVFFSPIPPTALSRGFCPCPTAPPCFLFSFIQHASCTRSRSSALAKPTAPYLWELLDWGAPLRWTGTRRRNLFFQCIVKFVLELFPFRLLAADRKEVNEAIARSPRRDWVGPAPLPCSRPKRHDNKQDLTRTKNAKTQTNPQQLPAA
jgi:hypothetical protein